MSDQLGQVEDHYDVIVVGGGIVGAGIFRDLALHGLKCLIIDQKDFSSQTSQSSSKMLHGGVRYLENMDFPLIFEALHEKNFWLKSAPHLCQERSFYLPVFKESKRPLWQFAIGLFIYDLLSGLKNSPYRILSKKKVIEEVPGIKEEGLRGAGLYHDAVVDDVKLTLEVIYDALMESGCQALNYVKFSNLKRENDRVYLELEDEINSKKRTVSCDDVVFALGPFTDQVMKNVPDLKWEPCIVPSKGSHLWIKRETLAIKDPMLLNTKDGRVIFVIPIDDAILVGTTESIESGDLFDVTCSEEEEKYLLGCLRDYFPHVESKKDCILSSFSGIRPLVRKGKSTDLGKISRRHKTVNPFEDVHIIVGGKYTTFRVMGREITKKICKSHNISYKKKRSEEKLRCPSLFYPTQQLTEDIVIQVAEKEHVRTLADLVKRRLGIWGLKHWKNNKSFEDFFLPLVPKLLKYFDVTEDDIRNFK